MKRTVFISHSSKDKAIGDEVCRFLEANGISCWIAPRDVTPGKNYGAAIVEAIDECAVFVLVLTSESNKSGQVVREVERAANANAVIIPLRAEAVQPSRDLEFYVSSSHWLDATEKPLAKHLGKLLDAIKNWKTDDEPAPERTTAGNFPDDFITSAAFKHAANVDLLSYWHGHRPWRVRFSGRKTFIRSRDNTVNDVNSCIYRHINHDIAVCEHERRQIELTNASC